jgi:hypothetical protein
MSKDDSVDACVIVEARKDLQAKRAGVEPDRGVEVTTWASDSEMRS